MEYLEIIGTAIGLIYLYLEYKASVWLWVASIFMPAVYIVVYYDAGLYADLGINVYYLIASLYGLLCWIKGKDSSSDSKPLKITRTPVKIWKYLFLVFILLFIAIGFLLQRFTDSTVPRADSFTTALSIVAMWMLARKYAEQWLVWIVADIGCGSLYLYKDLPFTGALYFLYAVIAVFGYRKWLKMMRT